MMTYCNDLTFMSEQKLFHEKRGIKSKTALKSRLCFLTLVSNTFPRNRAVIASLKRDYVIQIFTEINYKLLLV